MGNQEKRLRGQLVAVRHVIKSPEWLIMREFLASRLRSLWASACMAPTDSEKLRHVAASEGLIHFMRDFELEETKLEGWLEFGGFESDSKGVDEANRIQAARNQPRPYRED